MTLRRALVVDDRRLFAEAVKSVVERLGFTVSIATNGRRALTFVRSESPELVLLEVRESGGDDLALGRRILRELPSTILIAVTAAADPDLIREIQVAGFRGCVTKDTSLSRFTQSVGAAMKGESVHQGFLRQARRNGQWSGHVDLLASQLTRREWDVLRLLVDGTGGSHIANRLNISHNTVRTHIQSILTKLHVHSRLEAAGFAVRHGLIEAGSTEESGAA